MNKKVMIGILIIFIAAIFVVIRIISGDSKQIELTYKTNGGVAYTWQYEIEDESIVKFVKSYEIENQNKNGLVGAHISINYVFKGLKEGVTTITFKYVNITDGTIDKEDKVTVKVDNHKNISLVAIP